MLVLMASELIGVGRGVLSMVPISALSLFLYMIWKKAGLF